nr:glycosyltransferase [uncultured Cohaesibacter sp.]
MILAPHKIAANRIAALEKVEPEQHPVNLVFATDKNYIPYTAVTLASLLYNCTENVDIKVYILLDSKLSNDDLVKFEDLKNIKYFELIQVVVDGSLFENVKTTKGITIATYYRLLIHQLLPEDVDRALYLDGDLIIRKSICDLYSFKFDGALFAGVEDSISILYNRKFGCKEDDNHINAGVLLMNVGLMRSINFTELVELYLESNRYRLVLGDQQIINELFGFSIKYLPVQWNVHGSMFVKGWVRDFVGKKNNMNISEASKAIADPSIIHYTYTRKPWMSLEHPKSDEWFNYLNLTPYKKYISKPVVLKKKNEVEINRGSNVNRKKINLKKMVFVIFPATIYSFIRIRKTRLKVDALEKKFDKVQVISSKPAKRNIFEKPSLNMRLKRVLVDRSVCAPQNFNARSMLEALPENALVMSNTSVKDLEGGYAENIKTITKTSRFSFFEGRLPDAVFLLSQRIEQEMFWSCIQTAYLYDIPLYFVEVALFGAFASYFDSDATLNERRAIGFMIDDLGYYFDARQPSRIERTLNDSSFNLVEKDIARARSLMDRICAENITKYNKYVGGPSYTLEENAVLVIDQKKNDASIEFAGASDLNFVEMLNAAVEDNPGKPIYFKRHPDSIKQNMNSYRNRNISEIKVLPDAVSLSAVIDQCEKIYTVSSQVGFEGLLRGKKVVTFGIPFYAGWGLTDDRVVIPRRRLKRSVEELFFVACIAQSVYLNPDSGKIIEIEDAIDYLLQMRVENARRIS